MRDLLVLLLLSQHNSVLMDDTNKQTGEDYVTPPILCHSSELKVITMNCWGFPKVYGIEDKEERMAAIGEYIGQGQHDLYLLTELWLRVDHASIERRIPPGWSMTSVSSMTSGGCDGDII